MLCHDAAKCQLHYSTHKHTLCEHPNTLELDKCFVRLRARPPRLRIDRSGVHGGWHVTLFALARTRGRQGAKNELAECKTLANETPSPRPPMRASTTYILGYGLWVVVRVRLLLVAGPQRRRQVADDVELLLLVHGLVVVVVVLLLLLVI